MPGKLIVFEGGEGAGKTTQIQTLYAWLQAEPMLKPLLNQALISEIVTTREPGGSPLGKAIRSLLLEYEPQAPQEAIAPQTELLLYAADRAQHVQQFLRSHLESNALILCDRYTDSTVAYQGYGRELDLGMIEALNRIATGGLQSDLTLWLDMDVDAGLARTRQRGQADRMEKNHHTFHENVRRGFQALARSNPQRITRIDASQDVQTVARQIQEVVREKFREWYGL